MWAVCTVIAYFVLALLLPVAWALSRTWRRARMSRHLTCPQAGVPALVKLDPAWAVRMHARGDNEVRLHDCTLWDARCQCGQSCLAQLGSTV